MARPANNQRDAAIAALRTNTAQFGAKEGARLARQQFPNVPAGTWGRWRQQAVGKAADADTKASTQLAQEVRASIPAPEDLARAIADPLPATRKALDFWKMLDELETDAQLMRNYALRTDETGALKLRVPFALRDAHRMRCDLIRLALQQAEVAHGVERAQSFFAAVVSAVGEESPECQKRIMKRLAILNGEAAARGF